MKKNWMEEEIDWSKPRFWECPTCKEKIPSGIIGISKHWSECGGKENYQNLLKISEMNLQIEDKMDLVKNLFNVTQ